MSFAHAPERALFAYLDQLGIPHETIAHRPVFTVEDGRDIEDSIPGLHCKNLFLKDAKEALWLIVMPGDLRADIRHLQTTLGSARLSFGKPDLLQQVLGVTPGSVTPFALMNDGARRVTVVLDRGMMAAARVNYHPLRNDRSTVIASADLMRFITALGYTPRLVDCAPRAAE